MRDLVDARYLRVKNWADFQHYDPLKRRPPWIKFYNDLLGNDDGFALLTEQEQWQLVRIWLVASKSSALTLAPNAKGLLIAVPVIADDEQSLRRSIMSLKRIPLAKFIREGWLIPVEESELLASGTASAADSTEASSLLVVEKQRFREVDKPKGFSSSPAGGAIEKPSDFIIPELRGAA